MMLMIIICSSTTKATALDEKIVETNSDNYIVLSPEQSEINEHNYLKYSENIKYTQDDGGTTNYVYEGYVIERFDDFITISPKKTKNLEKQFISGSNFILTEDKIWFINDNRKISSFSYKEFSYPKYKYAERISDFLAWEYEKSNQYNVYTSVDIDSEKESKITKWVRNQDYLEINVYLCY